jgi:hypothetical protein
VDLQAQYASFIPLPIAFHSPNSDHREEIKQKMQIQQPKSFIPARNTRCECSDQEAEREIQLWNASIALSYLLAILREHAAGDMDHEAVIEVEVLRVDSHVVCPQSCEGDVYGHEDMLVWSTVCRELQGFGHVVDEGAGRRSSS